MTIKGVDTTDRTLTGATLKANGYAFVCRYYQYGGTNPGKQLTAAEAREKTAAGIRIVANYETDGNPANTIATGERHARNFLAQHADVGGPDWAPCYFSIDVNPRRADAFDSYAKGLRSVLGPGRVGVYGASALVRHWVAAGLAKYAWRTMSTAWLGGSVSTGCALIQTGGGHVAGHNVDFDTALAADYGGWLQGEADPNMALTQADANLVVATLVKDPNFQALIWRVAAEVNNSATVASGPTKGEVNQLGAQLAKILSQASSNGGGITALTTAVAKLPTSAAPAAPADVAAIANAVADLLAARLAS